MLLAGWFRMRNSSFAEPSPVLDKARRLLHTLSSLTPSPDSPQGLLLTPAGVWHCCLVLWSAPSLLPCSSSCVHTADASAKVSSFCACPSWFPLLILEHLADFRSFWILLLSFGTQRPSEVNVLCIPTHIPWVISKNIRQPPFTAVCRSPFYIFFPDTPRMFLILCRFLNKACNFITEVHLVVFSPSLHMRMTFATYIMMLAHLAVLSEKETELVAYDLFLINILAAFYPLMFLWVCRKLWLCFEYCWVVFEHY